jgi:hypothetical protein
MLLLLEGEEVEATALDVNFDSAVATGCNKGLLFDFMRR